MDLKAFENFISSIYIDKSTKQNIRLYEKEAYNYHKFLKGNLDESNVSLNDGFIQLHFENKKERIGYGKPTIIKTLEVSIDFSTTFFGTNSLDRRQSEKFKLSIEDGKLKNIIVKTTPNSNDTEYRFAEFNFEFNDSGEIIFSKEYGCIPFQGNIKKEERASGEKILENKNVQKLYSLLKDPLDTLIKEHFQNRDDIYYKYKKLEDEETKEKQEKFEKNLKDWNEKISIQKAKELINLPNKSNEKEEIKKNPTQQEVKQKKKRNWGFAKKTVKKIAKIVKEKAEEIERNL